MSNNNFFYLWSSFRNTCVNYKPTKFRNDKITIKLRAKRNLHVTQHFDRRFLSFVKISNYPSLVFLRDGWEGNAASSSKNPRKTKSDRVLTSETVLLAFQWRPRWDRPRQPDSRDNMKIQNRFRFIFQFCNQLYDLRNRARLFTHLINRRLSISK